MQSNVHDGSEVKNFNLKITNRIRGDGRTDFLGRVVYGIYLAENLTYVENTKYKQKKVVERWLDDGDGTLECVKRNLIGIDINV